MDWKERKIFFAELPLKNCFLVNGICLLYWLYYCNTCYDSDHFFHFIVFIFKKIKIRHKNTRKVLNELIHFSYDVLFWKFHYWMYFWHQKILLKYSWIWVYILKYITFHSKCVLHQSLVFINFIFIQITYIICLFGSKCLINRGKIFLIIVVIF